MAKNIWDNDIDKYTDWGGDESTGYEPVSGRAVQKFIKDTLNSKAGVFYYDAQTSRYLIFADEDTRDAYLSDPSTHQDLLLGVIQSEPNYIAHIDLIDTDPVSYVKFGSIGNYIKASYDIVDKNTGVSVGDDAVATIVISRGSVSQTITRDLTYGEQINLNIDNYLLEGQNNITISILGVNTYAQTTIGIRVYAIELNLTDSFDLTESYTQNDKLDIRFTVSGSGIKRMEWFLDGNLPSNQLPYDPVTDDNSEIEVSKVKEIDLSGLNDGRHNIQFRAYVELDSGQKFYSDTLYRDFMIDGETITNNDTIILTTFNTPSEFGLVDPFDDPINLYGTTQYENKIINYSIFNKSHAQSYEFEIDFDNNQTLYNIQNQTQYQYEIKSYGYGNKSLVFECNQTTMTFNVPVIQSLYNLREITGTAFAFSGSDRSNTSNNKDTWSYGEYNAQLTGFTWNENSGWNSGELIISEGASFSTDYAPMSIDATRNGATYEFEFKTSRVLDEDAVVLDLRKENSQGILRGLLITASEISFSSVNGISVSTRYKPEENIRVSIVINPISSGTYQGLLFMYIDGILTRIAKYAAGDSFVSDTLLEINGNRDAVIYFKQIRCYNRSLTDNEILNNFILYRDTVDELIDTYDRNDVYVENSYRMSDTKLAAQTPIIVITGNVDKLQNFTKEDKKTYVKMDKIEVINLQDPSRNMTLIEPSMRCQGTSSMEYPRKNFRFYTQADSKDTQVDPYTTRMFDADGKELIGKKRLYSFKDKAQPVKCWCLKADYAESSSTHNTGVARLWNNVMKNVRINDIDDRFYMKSIFPNDTYPCKTIAQHRAEENNYEYDVRTTVDGYPITLFYHLHEEDPLIFLGKYNWNNDKSTESVYGFTGIPGFDNTDMECWEVVNGDLAINQFISMDTWNDGKNNGGWQDNFESRYPDDSGEATEELRAQGSLKSICEWICSTRGASKVQDGKMVVDDQELMNKFSSEKWNHLDVYKVAAYYDYLMRFGAVDQTVKNAMFTTEDGVHWYYINYDNDTINGVSNDGALRFTYTINRQSEDPSSPGSFCYAGHESTLWNNLEADEEFMNIVKTVDSALYNAGLNYPNVIDMFNEKQSAQWAERTHNEDYKYKYLLPNDATQYPKLQGTRKSHRQWWLSNRFSTYDAIYGNAAYMRDFIGIKPNTFSDTPGPDEKVVIIPAVNNQIFGYGQGLLPVESGVIGYKDQPLEFQMTRPYYIGSQLNFYNSIYFKSFNCSSISRRIAEFHFDAVNTEAFDSALTTLTLGDVNSQDNSAVTVIDGLQYFKYLENFSMRHYNAVPNVDLSGNIYLKTVDARDCSALTNITLPNAAPLTSIHYPSNIANIYHNNLNQLSVVDIQGLGVYLKNVNIINSTGIDLQFLLNWINHKVSPDSECSLTMDNIHWTNVNPNDLIIIGRALVGMGQIGSDGYVYGLKGRADLTTTTQETVNELMSIFGPTAFQSSSDFYLTAPDAIYIAGPTEVLEGETVQYTAAVFSEHPGTVTFRVISGSRAGVTLSPDGTLTTIENGVGDTNFTIRAVHRPTSGSSSYADFNLQVKNRTYPSYSQVSIGGDVQIRLGDNIYPVVISATEINGDMIAEWSLTGDVSSIAEITSSGISQCIISIDTLPIETISSGVLTLVLKKAHVSGNPVVCIVSKSVAYVNDTIAISKSVNPYAMQVMYNNGLAANENYMTREEAANVIEIDLQQGISESGSIFYQNIYFRNGCQNFDEFQYFTGLTEVPDYLFSSCQIRNITLPPNVVTIKNYAFQNSSLTNINITDKITTIERNAFSRCYSLSNVRLGDHLTSIGSQAFYACNSISNIELPDSLQYIGSSAFDSCRIESLFIPANVSTIGISAFNPQYLTQISVDENNQNYYGSTCIIERSTRKLIIGCKNTIIPNDVLIIGNSAFSHVCRDDNNPPTLVIPYGVTEIQGNAFDWSGIIINSIPETVAKIGDNVFMGCTGITTFDLPNVTSIGSQAFGSSSITEVTNLNVLSTLLFNDCKNLTKLHIPKNATYVDRVVDGCSNLAYITVDPENTTYEGNGYNCVVKKSQSISVVKRSTGQTTTLYVKSIIIGCKNTAIPPDIQSIRGRFVSTNSNINWDFSQSNVLDIYQVFDYDSNNQNDILTNINITLNENTEYIPSIKYLVKYAKNLKSVCVGGVRGLRNERFCMYCPNLEEVKLEGEAETLGFQFCYQNGSSSQSLTIDVPEGLTSIAEYAFSSNCSNTTIICRTVAPPTASSDTFYNKSNIKHIYVPAESVTAYKTASRWSEFASIIEAIPSE